MENVVSVEKMMDEIKSSSFYLNCEIPKGYTAGLPVLEIRNDCLCMTIPYLKYKVTGEMDKTLVYPIRYGITMELPTKKIIGFENYEYRREFSKVDFDRPVGYFRHEAVKHLNKKQYAEVRRSLLACYDQVIGTLLNGEEYSAENQEKMASLLQMMTEPSLMLMYRAIAPEFYYKYMEKE